jgi:FAD:protein FMN transferase
MHTEAPVSSVDQSSVEVVGHTHAMATDIVIRSPRGQATDDEALRAAVSSALDVFDCVQSACTRFDAGSPLMRANAAPLAWHRVPDVLFQALVEASRAYAATGGRFDPRVYADLVGLGYDRTLPFESGEVVIDESSARPPSPGSRWRPKFRAARGEINLGGAAVDLGGIGKGLAVGWASLRLRQVTANFLVEAGGDCHCAGLGPGGERWRLGVEDPLGPDAQARVAVVELEDRACTTSSTRVRKWRVGGRPAHHLIDPSTGKPGGEGLVAVTVVGAEAAMSEVWSKALFLCGAAAIEQEAERRNLAALWVGSDGVLGASTKLQPYVIWQRR